jgi:hypothetical protein
MEFIRVFQKGLNPLKIQEKIQSGVVPNFLTSIMLRTGSGPNGRSCLEGPTLAPCQVSIILDIRIVFILYFEM